MTGPGSVADEQASVAADVPSQRVRPRVLALPAPTTSLFLVLVGGLLTAGAFAGAWLHLMLNRSSWSAALSRCTDRDWAGASGRCIARLEAARAWYMAAGIAIGLIGGFLVLLVLPHLIERRHRLKPLSNPRMVDVVARLDELTVQAGLRRAPTLVTTTGRTLTDPFSYGIPGRYRIALPLKIATLRKRDPALLDAVLRHELAHIRSGDVTLAWLAAGIGFVVAGILAVPIVASLFGQDRSLVVDYTWRALLLLGVVGLTQRTLLRIREHEADLATASAGTLDSATVAVARTRPTPAARWRRAFRTHPGRAERLNVLNQPERVSIPTFTGGLTAAFFVLLAAPLAHDLLTSALLTSRTTSLAWPIVAACAGAFLGGSVGVTLWRAAAVARVCGTSFRLAPVVCGVGVGALLGQTASLAYTGLAGPAGLAHIHGLLLAPLALMIATVPVAGLAAALADVLPRLHHSRQSWIACMLTSSTGFGLALWAAMTAQLLLDLSGRDAAGRWLFSGLPSWSFVLSCVVIMVAAAPSLRAAPSAGPISAWLVDGTPSPPWPPRPVRSTADVGLACALAGLTGAVIIVMVRLVAGPSSDTGALQRFQLYIWIAAATGAALALAATAAAPHWAMAPAVLAAPASALIAASAIIGINSAVGNPLTFSLIEQTARHAIALGAALAVPAAALGLSVRWRAARAATRPKLLAMALGCTLLTSLIAMTANAALRPGNESRSSTPVAATALPVTPTPSLGTQSALDDEATVAEDARKYLQHVAVPMIQRYAEIVQALNAMLADADPGPSARASTIRTSILAPLVRLRDEMIAVTPVTTPVRQVHATCTAALVATAEQQDLWAASLERDAPQLLAQSKEHGDEAQRQWDACDRGLQLLQQYSTPGQSGTTPPASSPTHLPTRHATTPPKPTTAPRSASAAQQTVAVPNVGANPLATATQKLAAVGLRWNVVNVADAVIPAGAVVRTTPAAWSVVPKGSTVTLYVSTGAG
ncbi:MAG: PASTA domain-containing protein [Micromonosporaceae bacterium]|nr:PASTA domain-containing protein [Micromonosporaceae bacterium]